MMGLVNCNSCVSELMRPSLVMSAYRQWMTIAVELMCLVHSELIACIFVLISYNPQSLVISLFRGLVLSGPLNPRIGYFQSLVVWCKSHPNEGLFHYFDFCKL